MAAPVELMDNGNGVDFVRSVLSLHCQSMFARLAMTKNLGLQGHALEDFILRGKPLPNPETTMAELVRILFHGRASWNAQTQCIDDVMKPVAPMLDLHNQKTAVNLSAMTDANAQRRTVVDALRSSLFAMTTAELSYAARVCGTPREVLVEVMVGTGALTRDETARLCAYLYRTPGRR